MGCALSKPEVIEDAAPLPPAPQARKVSSFRRSPPSQLLSKLPEKLTTSQSFNNSAKTAVEQEKLNGRQLSLKTKLAGSSVAKAEAAESSSSKASDSYNTAPEQEKLKGRQPYIRTILAGSSVAKSVAAESSSSKASDSYNNHLDSRKESFSRVRDGNKDRYYPNPRMGSLDSERAAHLAAGWPAWLTEFAGDAVRGWCPRQASSFERLSKIGQGTYSNVYKARDLETRKIVALKKVRFDNSERESVCFMAREIIVLRMLNHPNIIKLEGLVTSRMSCSLYLVFEYMEHDLAGLVACPGIDFTESQVKCYLYQLLAGLEHCHARGVLHRDIKGSNLLINNSGILKIADFGLATPYTRDQKQSLTSRVVTLWYRPPELLLGTTEYGVGVDLWSTGCILGELLVGRPIMPGRTEVEQLHKIFKLCGSPSEDYWKRSKLPHATMFKPQQPYKRCVAEFFKGFPSTTISLLDKLLAIGPDDRGTASTALKSEFFSVKPYACDPSSLPQYPPNKEMDAKIREEEIRRMKSLAGGGKEAHKDVLQTKAVNRDRPSRAAPAPEANAEFQSNIQRQYVAGRQGQQSLNARSRSEKFPVAHEDGVVGFSMEPSDHSKAVPETQNKSYAQPQYIPSRISKSGPMGPPTTVYKRNKEGGNNDGRMVPTRQVARINSLSVSQNGDFSNLLPEKDTHRERLSTRLKEKDGPVDSSRQHRRREQFANAEYSGSFKGSRHPPPYPSSFAS